MNMEQNNPLVVCSGLTKTYGSFTALDHLDLTLERGRFIGLLGPNGSGKTTTIKLLNGLLQPLHINLLQLLPRALDPLVEILIFLEVELLEEFPRVRIRHTVPRRFQLLHIQADGNPGVNPEDILLGLHQKVREERPPQNINGISHVGLCLPLVQMAAPDEVGRLAAGHLVLHQQIVQQRLRLLERKIDNLIVEQNTRRAQKKPRQLVHMHPPPLLHGSILGFPDDSGIQ